MWIGLYVVAFFKSILLVVQCLNSAIISVDCLGKDSREYRSPEQLSKNCFMNMYFSSFMLCGIQCQELLLF